MKRLFLGMLICTILVAFLAACTPQTPVVGAPTPIPSSTISPAGTGYNGWTYDRNLNEIIKYGTNTTLFNTTQTITTGGTYCNSTAPCMWVPWFSSSTECNITYLHSDNIGTPIMENKTLMVTDEFSEIGVVLSSANATYEPKFEQWYNTLIVIQNTCKIGLNGQLPCWSIFRNMTAGVTNISKAPGTNNDSASDANWRIVIALYTAARNNNFTDANRTKYQNLASAIMNTSLANETKFEAIATKNWGIVSWWAYAGTAAKNTGFTRGSSGASMYLGYYPDLLTAMLYHRAATGNATYDAMIGNFTINFFVATNWTNGNGNMKNASNFKMAPWRWVWNYTSTTDTNATISETNGGDDYYWTPGNPPTDTADAPRVGDLCGVVRIYNDTGHPVTNASTNSTWANLTNYCTNWGYTNSFTATASCQQYNWTNGCAVGPFDGFKLNGMFIGFHTYMNTSQFTAKLDNIFTTHTYSWAGTHTFDSTHCGNGLTYDTIRATKALIKGMGYDEAAAANLSSPAPPATPDGNVTIVGPINFTLISPLNGTSLINNGTINFSVKTWKLNGTASNYTVKFFFSNGTLIGNSTNTTTNGSITTFLWNLTRSGRFDWYAFVNTTNNTLYVYNLTFNETNTTELPLVSRCVNMSDIIFRTNTTRGTNQSAGINYTSLTYTEYNITPLNQSACLGAFYVANILPTAFNITISTNQSNPNITMTANGQIINSTKNYTAIVSVGTTAYVNFSLNITRNPLIGRMMLNITAITNR
jgi:hypothetical protein